MQTLTLQIQGMSCNGCVRNVTTALQKLPGVTVNNVAVGSAQVSIDPTIASPEAVKQAIESRGFHVAEAR